MPEFIPSAPNPDGQGPTGATPTPPAAPVPGPAPTPPGAPVPGTPFGSGGDTGDWSDTVVGAVATPAETTAEAEGQGASKAVVGAVIFLGVALIAAGGYLFMTGDNGGASPTPGPSPTAAPTTPPTPDPTAAPPALTNVPNTVGLPLADATAMLTNAGFVLGEVTAQPFDATVDTVLAQNPNAGVQAAPGAVISLIVSAPAKIAVPDVVGLTKQEATPMLEAAGFTVKTRTKPSATAKPGTVLVQIPNAGMERKPGVVVTLTLATAPDSKVPNVVGKTEKAAKATLRDSGFKVTVKTGTKGAEGKVTKQDPTGSARPGSTITITVGPKK